MPRATSAPPAQERAAFAKVVLHVNDDEGAHGPTVSRLVPGSQRSPAPDPVSTESARAAGDAGKLRERRREDRVRMARCRPDDLVPAEPYVDKRPDLTGMANRRDAADRLPGVRPDEVRVGPLDGATPSSAATLPVSTRCAPLVRMSSGAPSALNTRLLAMAPTSQPSCAAAAAAVGAGSGSSLTSRYPGDRSACASSASDACRSYVGRSALHAWKSRQPPRPGPAGGCCGRVMLIG